MDDVPRDIRANERKDRAFVTFARICALTIVLTVVGPCCLGMVSVGVDGPREDPHLAQTAAQVAHDPIFIEGDDEFTEENGVTGGTGTHEDPYVITGWTMNMEDALYPSSAIRIANTTSAFVVSDIRLYGDRYANDRGICLVNVTSARVTTCVVEYLYVGIGVQSSSWVNITSNTLIASSCEISGSENVSFAQNEGYYASVGVTSSRDVTVTDNRVNYSLSTDYARGLSVRVSGSDRCIVTHNVLSGPAEMEAAVTGGVVLYQSTNCTVDWNAMNAYGLGFDAREPEHYSTHAIGQNNTVRTLPLRFYKDTEGVIANRSDFGQMIVYNCSDVRLRDLTIVGLYNPIRIISCSDVEISDCRVVDTPFSMTVSGSHDVRLRHNVFENRSEVWIRDCERVDFSYNRMEESGFYVGQMNDSSVRYNEFGIQWGETSFWTSRDLILQNNVFGKGGLRYEGMSIDDYEHVSIDLSNTGLGGKPILFLKNQSDIDVNLANHSQLIMANCSDVDVHGMTTGSENALQIAFSTRISVHDCGIYGYHPINLHYADGIMFYENDFVNPMFLMSLFMTHNVTTYHCNILGSYGGWICGGFDDYTPTNIRWDNGYPDGGNYWEGWKAYDNYSGPAQDEPGSDGICDRPKEIAWGYDRYPLATPYVRGRVVEPDSVWQDPILWLSAMAGIVIASIAISYVLFVREGPRKPEPVPRENREGT